MDYQLQVFSNPDTGSQLRTHTDINGISWFCAKDIAQALGYSEESNPARLFGNVPEIWRGVKRFHTRSENGVEQTRELLCVTLEGAYFFLGRSDKPKALPYQMWIAGDVVPSIKKHGAYMTPKFRDELLSDPDLLIRLAQELKAERAKVAALQEQTEKDKPKVIFADAVDSSKQSILIGNLAKILRQNGINIGQNRLFAWLRDHGYLIKARGDLWNMPTQKSIERGLFEVKIRVINNPDGSSKITKTTKVTGKGQIFFVNKFIQEKRAATVSSTNNKSVDAHD